MLIVEHLQKRYDSVPAVDDITFGLENGQSLILIGESGSGKTTLARMIAGSLRPDSGRILLDGHPLGANSRRRSFEKCVSIQYVFQDPYSALDTDFTVRRVLHETTRICQRHRRGCLSAEEALEYVDPQLIKYLDRRVSELSGGQRQKVCIARALMPHPKVIIADEPTSMLDRQSGLDVFNLLNRIKREKQICLLVVLHDIDLSYSQWDQIAVMWQGQIVEQTAFADFPTAASHEYSRALLSAYQYFNGGICHDS